MLLLDDTTTNTTFYETEEDRIQILNGTERLSYFTCETPALTIEQPSHDTSIRDRLARLLRVN